MTLSATERITLTILIAAVAYRALTGDWPVALEVEATD